MKRIELTIDRDGQELYVVIIPHDMCWITTVKPVAWLDDVKTQDALESAGLIETYDMSDGLAYYRSDQRRDVVELIDKTLAAYNCELADLVD